MQANAFELGRNAVEKKSFVRIKHGAADAERCRGFIHNDRAHFDLAAQLVKFRRFHRPQLRLRNFHFLN